MNDPCRHRRGLARVGAITLALAGAGACNGLLGIDDVIVRVDAGGADDSGPDEGTPMPPPDAADGGGSDTGADAGPPQPNPACRVTDVDRPQTTFQLSQSPLPAATPLGVVVRDTETGFSNVNLTICTPTSPTAQSRGGSPVGSGPPFTWTFDAGTLPVGVSQLGFRADPSNNTLYETAYIEVR